MAIVSNRTRKEGFNMSKTTSNFIESLIKEMGTHDTVMLKAIQFLRAK
jgi:hypothetical protein